MERFVIFPDARSTLRIVGSQNGQGRVEVSHHGIWGTICDDDWGVNEARVVCNILGYPGVFAALPGPSVVNGVWFKEFRCKGNESSLHECGNIDTGVRQCTHVEDAGVICDKGNDFSPFSKLYQPRLS